MSTPARTPWHSRTVETVLSELQTSANGLAEGEVTTRRATHGRNVLLMAPPTPAWQILVHQFRSIIVGLLGAAAVLAWLTADPLDAAAIAVVLVLNVALGFVTEIRARRAIEALSSLSPRRTMVLRPAGGSDAPAPAEIDAADLVPGDVIVVEAGNTVPADARVISATGLRVNEAPLTGESLPVSKRIEPSPEQTPLAEREGMIFSGTAVLDGRGHAVVVATGMQTEIGHVGTLLTEVKQGRTPLEQRLDQLGGRLVWLALGVAALVGTLGWFQGQTLSAILATSIALAVAAVPEGLPAVATIALAVGVHRMARRHALVRRLPSVESLGSVTVVCTDKTGTLTSGEMTATRIWLGDGEHHVSGAGYGPEGSATPPIVAPYDLAVRVAVLAGRGDATREGDVWVAHGDPTDVALLVLGRKVGNDRKALLTEWPEIAEVPFSNEYNLMATFHQTKDTGIMVCVKGAPGALLDRSARWLGPDAKELPLDHGARSTIEKANETLAAAGLRVIGLASRTEAAGAPTNLDALKDLTFLGLAGIIDPPAQGVDATIQQFRRAGIRTVMITGDQQLTARAVGQALGVLENKDDKGEVTTGQTVDGWNDEQLAEALPALNAFSRVSPEAKLRIVKAAQSRGQIVAVLGDGINDAAALKQADVGVAMGRRGTDVAREAADVVLQDDNFPTIGAAIEEGRVIYDNIRKFVFYLFSCNLAEILVLLTAGLVGGPMPLVPIQILWLNLATDTLPALALALEPAEPGLMDRPPRDPRAALLSGRFLRAITFHSATIAGVTLVAFWVLPSTSPEHAQTLAFMTLALGQLFHLGNARSREPIWAYLRIHANPWAVGALAAVAALQLAAVSIEPLRRALHTTPISAQEWLLLVALAIVPALIGQTLRACRSTAFGRTALLHADTH
jgi:Ca2+-transporting ATPase